MPCLSTNVFYKNAITPIKAASMAIASLPTALAEKRSASLLNVVAEAAGVATDDMVLLVPMPVLNGALVTTVAMLVDPVTM